MARRTTRHVVGQRLTGVVFLLVPALLIWLSIAIYDKQFTEATKVTLRTSTAGHEMHPMADVKVRGVVVGEVRSIKADGAGAKLELALKPGMTDRIPADVQARLLPTTVFGARFVSLVPPPGSAGRPIADGDVISEDRSKNAVELSEVLNHTMDLLNTLQPAKLSATLNAMSRALEGRGDQIGRNFEQLDAFLTKMNPEVPALTRNLQELAEFTQHASDAAPDLLQALTDFTVTSRTIAEQRTALATLYDAVSGSSADLQDFLDANSGNIIALATESRGSLELMRRYAPAAPCTFRTLADFIPTMNKVLGKGTDKHGVHGVVVPLKSKGRYVPGKDAPRYDGGNGPHCPSVPYLATGNGVRVLPAGGAPGKAGAAGSGLGPANSASENDLVNELAGPPLDEVPEELPDWSSVLVGPIYRGTEVTVK
ncbi:phospholipid/cholesterol/gamma-HCH transport system substrate-binding protein [Actinomadura meyerae]|uniref:Phospholipid/cholesterol/gamma-HCH transport system substrate-binding protein n=1 Tax=Actinomadura meyerae TaxID=240840 RepID=A0A239ICT8_9ACTN|nr:MCE family protein [Actinomadura meyerae]SNS91391.1 phospholipid/cholesterol/gamma-HCH transport system substrate-binding protein [Actinomadura meyerae]